MNLEYQKRCALKKTCSMNKFILCRKGDIVQSVNFLSHCHYISVAIISETYGRSKCFSLIMRNTHLKCHSYVNINSSFVAYLFTFLLITFCSTIMLNSRIYLHAFIWVNKSYVSRVATVSLILFLWVLFVFEVF